MPLSPKSLHTPRNLVLVHMPGWQAVQDFMAVRDRIAATAPDLAVLIANTQQSDRALEDLASRRPTLVVSPTRLGAFRPRRGRLYHGRPVAKDEQLARLQALSIPIPRTTRLIPGISLDPALWGSHVIIKPTSSRSSRGVGFLIAPTGKVSFRGAEHYPEGHPGRLGPLMVQQFIETGPTARHYRVNTLFGRALYCLLNISIEALPDLQSITNEFESSALATNSHDPNKRAFELVADKDVIELAARCQAAFPDVPLKGVDIVRDYRTGQLYVLELNCTSNTWHISSNYFAEFRKGSLAKEKMVAQFGAWDVAAAVLIERTRQDAI
jgi:hypothetical protein